MTYEALNQRTERYRLFPSQKESPAWASWEEKMSRTFNETVHYCSPFNKSTIRTAMMNLWSCCNGLNDPIWGTAQRRTTNEGESWIIEITQFPQAVVRLHRHRIWSWQCSGKCWIAQDNWLLNCGVVHARTKYETVELSQAKFCKPDSWWFPKI